MRSWMLVVALVTAACAGAAKSSTLPSRSGESLWRFAPPTAQVGLVVQGGALPELLVAAERWLGLIELFPLAQPALREVRAAQKQFGLDRLDRASLLARTGLDLALPLAVFTSVDDRAGVLFVLPVVDRAVWRRFAEVKVEGDLERFGKLVCAGDGPRYICARDESMLRVALAGPKDSPLAAKHARVPADLHGELEMVVDPGDTFDNPGPAGLIAPTVVAASLSLDDHGLVAHVWGDVRLEGELAGAAALPLRAGGASLLRGASGVARLLVPRVFIEKGVADKQGPGAAIFQLLTGEMLWATRGSELAGGSLHLFVRDPSAAARLLEQLCRLGAGKLRWTPGRCEMDYPAMSGLPAGTLAARLADGAWVLSIGDRGPAGEAPAMVHPLMVEMIEGPAHLAMWGVGLDLLAGLPDELRGQLVKSLPENARPILPAIELASFLAASVYEMGLRVGQGKDGLRIDLMVTTFAGEPEAVRREHTAALRLRATGDYTGYRAAMATIARKHPGSLLARQARELEGRGPVIGLPGVALVGMVAAIGVTAFDKYVARARGEEARAYVRALAVAAAEHHRAKGALPAGKAESAPRGSCCQQECVVADESPWRELGVAGVTSKYTFEYETVQDGFRVRAVGDRDCDGELSIFETGGVVEEGGGLIVSPEIYETQPLE